MEFGVRVFRNDFISLLEPIFNKLITLDISGTWKYEVNPKTDLTELLPKLKEIKPNRFLQYCLKKSLPSLETFKYEEKFNDGEEIFFALNPQLRCLKLADEGVHNLKFAVAYLPNIEQVSLRTDNWNLLDSVNHLQRFANLSEIN